MPCDLILVFTSGNTPEAMTLAFPLILGIQNLGGAGLPIW